MEGAQRDQQTAGGCVRPHVSSEQQQQSMVQQSMREHFAGQLMQHEWMTDIPEDLGHNWCACSSFPPHADSSRCRLMQPSCRWQAPGRHLVCGMQACPASSRRSALPGYSVQKPHGKLLKEGCDSAPLPVATSWRISTDG